MITMRITRILPLLCLSVLLILAGCTTGPFEGQESDVAVTINNSANTTHAFEIWVVEGVLDDKEVTIQKKEDGVDRASPGPGLSTYKLDEDYGYVTSIDLPPDQSRFHGNYTLTPGETNETLIENADTGSTVIVVIYGGNRIVSLVAAHCGNDLAFLEVTMFHYGSGSAYNCEGGFL
jgi:hypothetical protein